MLEHHRDKYIEKTKSEKISEKDAKKMFDRFILDIERKKIQKLNE